MPGTFSQGSTFEEAVSNMQACLEFALECDYQFEGGFSDPKPFDDYHEDLAFLEEGEEPWTRVTLSVDTEKIEALVQNDAAKLITHFFRIHILNRPSVLKRGPEDFFGRALPIPLKEGDTDPEDVEQGRTFVQDVPLPLEGGNTNSEDFEQGQQ
ncbi:MAG: hypothetical protein SGARI_001649 [Bacillariaceae sp.]